MPKFTSQDMPNKYKLLMKNIDSDSVLRKIYERFKFHYFLYPSFIIKEAINNNKKQSETYFVNYLVSYLKNFRFITYEIGKITDNEDFIQISDIFICYEDECIIIEKIDITIIDQIISSLKEHEISLINISLGCKKDKLTNQNQQEEVQNFCLFFRKQIKSNDFISKTINPISCFLIRRYFYPTEYFKNGSFFIFDQSFNNNNSNCNEINEATFKKELITLFKECSLTNDKLNSIEKYERPINNNCFYQDEFIYLRTIDAKNDYVLYLVFHIKTFYIFLMKKYETQRDSFKKEFYFCKNFSHRCLTPFYGFLLDKSDKIIGFLYEYLCNDVIDSNVDKLNNVYSLMTLIRLSQGIQYLHSKELIHRDLKPSNILLDHDYIPYLSDFNTIRHPDNEMTSDVGSPLFYSPEQEKGGNVSYHSDIFSFGLIIYFLYEKKYCSKSSLNTNEIVQMTNGTKIIQEIFESCIKQNPEERIKINDIIKILLSFINSFLYILYSLIEEIPLVRQLIYEIIMLQSQNNEHSSNLYLFNNLFTYKDNFRASYLNAISDEFYKNQFYSKSKEILELATNYFNDSDAYCKLGYMYLSGEGVNKNFIKAKELFEIAAKQNCSTAFVHLGFLYLKGYGVEKNYSKAKNYFELALNTNICYEPYKLGLLFYNGDEYELDYPNLNDYFDFNSTSDISDAYYNLGNLYENGYGVEQNISKALEYYKSSAELNNSNALNKLSSLFFYGQDVEQDYSKAKIYAELAAHNNDSYAFLKLGYLYLGGNGVETNYSKSVEYFKLAANLNNPYALYALGSLYFEGVEVEQNYSKAIVYFTRSALSGVTEAYTILGYVYERGLGVKQNYDMAIKYYNLAAQNNDSVALYNLGVIYFFGLGVEKNYIKAKEYFEQSAKQNDPNALLNLGVLYEKGYVVEKNNMKAKECYELSAKQNNVLAINKLASFYEEGYCGARDFLKAKYYYELSAQQGEPTALYKLGKLYENGNGVKQDYSMAIKYFKLSGQQGDSNAFYTLGNLYENGDGVKQDYSVAIQYYESSSRLENSQAFLALANIYIKGKGVKQDKIKAIKYYESSIKYNDPDAFFYLGELYSNGDLFDVNIEKSLYFFNESIKIHSCEKKTYNAKMDVYAFSKIYNNFFYHSNNDIGLIYMIEFNDINKANEYIKEAAFGEYPYGQNNFAFLNEYFFNNMEKAEYMYKKSSKHHFALAEYNLGHMKEKEGKEKESIDFYINASNDEDQNLVFHGEVHNDKRLKISIKFIICFTNLKLTKYYFSNGNYDESKKYFIEAFTRLKMYDEKSSYKFRFHFSIHQDKLFSYLKAFILSFPDFNILNQQNFDFKLKEKIRNEIKIENQLRIDETYVQNDKLISQKNASNITETFIDDPGILFDLVMRNEYLKDTFIDEIQDILDIMNDILYTPPYPILLGRIYIGKPKQKNKYLKNINELFYEGFGYDLYSHNRTK